MVYQHCAMFVFFKRNFAVLIQKNPRCMVDISRILIGRPVQNFWSRRFCLVDYLLLIMPVLCLTKGSRGDGLLGCLRARECGSWTKLGVASGNLASLSCFGRNIVIFQGAGRGHWGHSRALHKRATGTKRAHLQLCSWKITAHTNRWLYSSWSWKEWGRKGEILFFPNSQYLIFPRRSWLSLHTSIISKGTRLWEALLPLWQCVQNAVQGCREGTVFPASWVAFPPGIHVALERPSSQEQRPLTTLPLSCPLSLLALTITLRMRLCLEL